MQTRTMDPALAGHALEVGPDTWPVASSRISWGAVLAGAILALTVVTALNVLGTAVGMLTVDATGRDTPSGMTLGMAGGLWMLASHLFGLGFGAWVAARLSGTVDRGDGGLHGLAVWAVGFLASAIVLGSLVAGIASTTATGLATIAGGAARGVGGAAQAVGQQADIAGQAERIAATLRTGGDPAAMASEQRAAEIGSIVTQAVGTGGLDDAQRERLSALVAAEAGIPPEEATRRVQAAQDEVQRRVAAAEEQARRAADTAAAAAAGVSFWIFGAMVLGALAGLLGGRAGTREEILVPRVAH